MYYTYVLFYNFVLRVLLRAGRKKGGRSRTTESGNERAEEDGGVVIEPDEKLLEEVKKDLGRQ
jgi:hypothetical protein